MTRICARILLLTILAFAAPAVAPVAAQAPTTPQQQPGVPPVAAPGTDRNTGFDHIMAFAGVALALLVVCYPSRRY